MPFQYKRERRRDMCVIGTASVLRHGVSRYTGIFPDLVEDHLGKLTKVAKEIMKKFPKKPIFVSSPTERTVASALHIMNTLGLASKREDVPTEEMLKPIKIWDYKIFLKYVEYVVGDVYDPIAVHRAWDAFYMKDDVFETGEFCETRSSAKERFLAFLRELPSMCGPDNHIIVVTHLELVGTIVQEWFTMNGQPVFMPSEVVHLTFFEDGSIKAEFRGLRRTIPSLRTQRVD